MVQPVPVLVTTLLQESEALEVATPDSGLLTMETNLDPSLTNGNRLAGQKFVSPHNPTEVFTMIEVHHVSISNMLYPLRRKEPLALGDLLFFQVGLYGTGCRVLAIEEDLLLLQLASPLCVAGGEQFCYSRRLDRCWIIEGIGKVISGRIRAETEIHVKIKRVWYVVRSIWKCCGYGMEDSVWAHVPREVLFHVALMCVPLF